MIHTLAGLLRHEAQRRWHYPMALFWNVLFDYAFFVLVFLGVQVAGVGAAARSDGLVVGYWVWKLTGSAFESTGSYVSNEASTGTLEQLYLSPFPFGWVAFGRVLGNFLYNLAVYVPFLFLLMLTTRQWLTFDVLSILPLVVVTMAQAYGVGLIMAGVALVHKRVSVLNQVVTTLFAIAIAAPPNMSPFVRFLPLNLAWRLLNSVMSDGTPLWRLPPGDVAFVALQTVLFVGLGWRVYRGCERIARAQALLGQY